MTGTPRRTLYPAIEPSRSGRLRVSDQHEIHWEECGNPAGKPVVVLHGGPGGGIMPYLRQGHDPARYRIVLFDQRGCGKSTPTSELEGNTTWDLVADIERLRLHLGIDRWQVAGGSWGSTLALAYAVTHPGRVTELVLRGLFTLRRAEIGWFYQWGAGMIHPEAWAGFLAPIPEAERGDLLAAYHRRLTGPDAAERLACARAWSRWEGATLSLWPAPDREEEFGAADFADAFARIECHYFVNGGFFPRDGWLIDEARRLSDIPVTMIHGRHDVVTPLDTAHLLKQAMPWAELLIISDAGHTGLEPGIQDAMVRTTDLYAERGG